MAAREWRARGDALPAWIPLYALVVVGATFAPFRFSETPASGWDFQYIRADFIGNLLLFVPLGIAWGRRSWIGLLLVAGGFSMGIEFAQGWMPRHRNAVDLLANLGGAILGGALIRWVPLPQLDLRGRWIHLAALALALTLISHAVTPANDFSNWQIYPLTLGNVATGERRWNGTVSAVAVYDRALAIEEPDAVTESPPPPWSEGGPVVWISFGTGADGTPVTVGRQDGPGGPVPLELPPLLPNEGEVSGDGLSTRDGITLPGPLARHLLERLQATSRITLSAGIRPGTLDDPNPTRIFSFAPDVHDANVSLLQRGRELAFRLRSPATGTSGTYPYVRTKDAPLDLDIHRVRAVYDGTVSRIEVDGTPRAEVDIALKAAGALVGTMVGATIIGCTSLGALGYASLRRRRRDDHPLRSCAIGGTLTWLLLRWAGVWGHVRDFEGPAIALGLASIAAATLYLWKTEEKTT